MKWRVAFMCFSQPHRCSLLFEKWNVNGLFGQVIWLLINISIAPSTFLGLSHKQNCAKRTKGTGSPCLGSRKLPVSAVATGLDGCVWRRSSGFHYLNRGCTCHPPLAGHAMLPAGAEREGKLEVRGQSSCLKNTHSFWFKHWVNDIDGSSAPIKY